MLAAENKVPRMFYLTLGSVPFRRDKSYNSIALALIWSRFAYIYATAFLKNPAPIAALFFVLKTSIVIAFCIRRPATIQYNQ